MYVIGISRIILSSLGWGGLGFYLGGAAVCFMVGVVCLKLPASIKINAALALVSTAATLYVIECTLMAQDRELLLEQRILDTRSKLAVIADYRRQGVKAVAAIPSSNLLGDSHLSFLPISGIAQTRTILCNEVGTWESYISDEHGFRNPMGLYHGGVVEIAAVGDSFTHGVCVKDSQTMMGLIRQAFPRSLNFGWMGNGPLLEFATLVEFVVPLRPARVLWFYYEGNDLNDLESEKRHEILRRYLDGKFTQQLLDRVAEVDHGLQGYFEDKLSQEAEEFSSVEQFLWYYRKNQWLEALVLTKLRSRIGLYVSVQNPNPPVDLSTFKTILGLAKDRVQSWGGQLFFVYLCEKARFSHPKNASGHRDAVLSLTRELGIPTIDSYEVLRQEETLTLFQGHYTPKGNRLVAKAVVRHIEKDGLDRVSVE